MGETIKYGFIFTIGVAIGAGVTYGLLKGKYERIANEEIADMKEYYANKYDQLPDKENFLEEDIPVEAENIKIEEKPNIRDYASIINKESYNRADVLEKDGEPKPYVITPDEFGEIEEYDKISLTYYADGFLTDDMDEIVADIEGTVGWDAVDHIGEYEDDAVHIRNDERECDYEILADMRNYKDIKQEE